MGVAKATQHLESLPLKRLGKFQEENDECYFHTQLPKLKRRRIIRAVRDFPPGCGRYDQVTSSVGNCGDLHGVKTDLMNEISDLPENLNQLNNLSPAVEAASGDETSEKVECLSANRYRYRRTVSAVRDFPPFMGRHLPPEVWDFGQERSDIDEEPLSSSSSNTENWENVQEEEFDQSELGENDSEVDSGQEEEFDQSGLGENDSEADSDQEEFDQSGLGENGSEVDSGQEEEFDQSGLGENASEVDFDEEEEFNQSGLGENDSEVDFGQEEEFDQSGLGENDSEVDFGQETSDMDEEPSSLWNTENWEDVQEEEFDHSELGEDVSEVNFGEEGSGMDEEPSLSSTASWEDIPEEEFHEIQPECKGYAVQELESEDECEVYSKMKISQNTRKKCIESPQESNECQGSTREECLDVSYYHKQLHEEDFGSSELPPKSDCAESDGCFRI